MAAVSVGAQQHGMVCLDGSGEVVRDALLWNDTRSSDAAGELVDELGGADQWAKRIGVVPVAAITASKLRWLADHEPDHADATAAVCLPHDWLTWRLTGSTDIGDLRTDRSDASGTGYFSAETDSYQPDLLELAFRGRRPALPTVLGPRDVGRADRGGRAARPRRRRQRRGRAGPWRRTGGLRGLARHVRCGERGGAGGAARPRGDRRRFRRRHRTATAAGLHAQWCTRAGRRHHDAWRGLRRDSTDWRCRRPPARRG